MRCHLLFSFLPLLLGLSMPVEGGRYGLKGLTLGMTVEDIQRMADSTDWSVTFEDDDFRANPLNPTWGSMSLGMTPSSETADSPDQFSSIGCTQDNAVDICLHIRGATFNLVDGRISSIQIESPQYQDRADLLLRLFGPVAAQSLTAMYGPPTKTRRQFSAVTMKSLQTIPNDSAATFMEWRNAVHRDESIVLSIYRRDESIGAKAPHFLIRITITDHAAERVQAKRNREKLERTVLILKKLRINIDPKNVESITKDYLFMGVEAGMNPWRVNRMLLSRNWTLVEETDTTAEYRQGTADVVATLRVSFKERTVQAMEITTSMLPGARQQMLDFPNQMKAAFAARADSVEIEGSRITFFSVASDGRRIQTIWDDASPTEFTITTLVHQ